MDLKQIEYFVHVADLGGYTKASEFLGVAQPAISRKVRALEVELRQALFDRNGRGVTLTEAGKRFLAHGRGILAQVERARLDVEEQRGTISGRIVIGMPPAPSRVLSGPLVRSFQQRFPKATFSLVEGLSAYLVEWLAVGRVDLALVYNGAAGQQVEFDPICVEPMYLVTRRSGARGLTAPAMTLAQVARRRLVMPGRPHFVRLLLETALGAQGLKPNVELEIESVPTILDLVRDAGYDAVLALNAVKFSSEPEAFQAHPIGKPPLGASLMMATSTQRPRGPLLDQSAALLRELVNDLWQ